MGGTGSSVESIREASSGEVVTDPIRIGEALTDYWQKIFDDKPTDALLREQWLNRFRSRCNHTFSLEELTPTQEDVDKVLDNLPTSAPGPDGIPFSASL